MEQIAPSEVSKMLDVTNTMVTDKVEAMKADCASKLDKLINATNLEMLAHTMSFMHRVRDNMYGLGKDSSYLHGISARMSWTRFKDKVTETLGQSELATTLDETVKDAHKVIPLIVETEPSAWIAIR